MVYNAMKLFMEVNPQLFDECSHDYAEHQNNAEQREESRQLKWDRVMEQAKLQQNGRVDQKPATTSGTGSKVITPMRSDDLDPLSQDSQRRLEALRLQDDALSGRDRRHPDFEKQASVSFVELRSLLDPLLPHFHCVVTLNAYYDKPNHILLRNCSDPITFLISYSISDFCV